MTARDTAGLRAVPKRQDGLLRRTLARVLSLFGSRVAGTALGFVTTLVMLRIAAPDAFGLAMAGSSWCVLLSLVLTLNVDAGAIRYMVRYRQENRLADLAGFTRFSALIFWGLSGLTWLAAAATVWTGLLDPGQERDRVLLLALLGAPLPAYMRLLMAQATALDVVVRGALATVLGQPLALCLLLAAFALRGGAPDAPALMLLTVLSFLIGALAQRALLIGLYAPLRGVVPRFSDWRHWLRSGLLLSPHIVLNNNLKQLVIAAAGLSLGAAQLGEFSLAISVLGLLLFGVKAVDIVYSPSLSRAIQSGDGPGTVTQLRQSALIKSLGAVLGAACFLVLGNWFLGLFGDSYRTALLPMLLLLALPAAEALFGPTGLVMNVTGRIPAFFLSSVVGLVLIAGATALGGWGWGSTGAAAGCGLGYLLTKWGQLVLCRATAGVDSSLATLWTDPGRAG